MQPAKDKTTAGVLGLLLGGVGIHHFYLGNTLRGIIYILLAWTFIPAFVGFIEGIMYLASSDEAWLARVGTVQAPIAMGMTLTPEPVVVQQAPEKDIAVEIEKFAKLLDSGAITEDEFAAKKAKLLED